MLQNLATVRYVSAIRPTASDSRANLTYLDQSEIEFGEHVGLTRGLLRVF